MTAALDLPYKFWTRRSAARSPSVLTERSSRSLAAVALSAQHFLSSALFGRHVAGCAERIYTPATAMHSVTTQGRLGQGK